MSRYFMQDTRHAAFERMMMSVPMKRDDTDRREKPRPREKKSPVPPKERAEK